VSRLPYDIIVWHEAFATHEIVPTQFKWGLVWGGLPIWIAFNGVIAMSGDGGDSLVVYCGARHFFVRVVYGRYHGCLVHRQPYGVVAELLRLRNGHAAPET
jgi:hypothetical protein